MSHTREQSIETIVHYLTRGGEWGDPDEVRESVRKLIAWDEEKSPPPCDAVPEKETQTQGQRDLAKVRGMYVAACYDRELLMRKRDELGAELAVYQAGPSGIKELVLEVEGLKHAVFDAKETNARLSLKLDNAQAEAAINRNLYTEQLDENSRLRVEFTKQGIALEAARKQLFAAGVTAEAQENAAKRAVENWTCGDIDEEKLPPC